MVYRPTMSGLAWPPKQCGGRALIAHVSVLYYLEGRTQDEIARQLQLSRAKVSRLLCEAREAGIVRIFIRPPPGTLLTLETELEARFGVHEVRIIPSARDEPLWTTRRKLGSAAAADLARSARAGQTVGLVGMELLASMVDAVVPNVATGVRVVQGVGWEPAPSPQRTLADLVLDLARRIEGTAVVLPAPSAVESAHVRRSLVADPQIGDALHALDALDTLYTEVAPAAADGPRDCDEGVPVGRIALRHFDSQGQMLGTVADGHVVGLTIGQLHRARHVVALANDPARPHVIAAALRTRLVDTLITDEMTARALAALPASRTEAARIAGKRMYIHQRPTLGENHDDEA
ncbi:MAG TPA: sugar-binding domain-containing protein [Gemmatimonadaceae bacterium]